MLRDLRSTALTLLVLLSQVACGGSKEAPAEPAAKPISATAPRAEAPKSSPLRIAYSDWPGWVAWEIGIQKKWFEEEGVAVDFKWFEYVPSMEAFSAGKVDAVTMTNGDALVTGSSGAPSVAIVLNDYSNGNDMVVAGPAIADMKALKGKKVGVEVGFVSHLLLINALKSVGLTDKDIRLVNVPTDQTPQLLKSGEVDAIVAWQPNSGQALKDVAGSKAIFTSANVPGLIYDVLGVNPKSLSERRDEWRKVVKVWFRIADFLKQPENLAEAANIMGARVGMEGAKYKELMKGTYFLDLAANVKHFTPGGTLESVHFSDKIVDEFQVKNDVYKKPVDFESYLDSSLIKELSATMAAAR
jgi:NitT/TauT family transport system substrate-binding protein